MPYRFFLVILGFPFFAIGQPQNTANRIKSLLTRTRPDTSRVNALNEVAGILAQDNAEQGLYYANQAISLSGKLHFNKGLGNAYYNRADIFISLNKVDAAKTDLNRAILIQSKANENRELAKSFSFMGWILGREGKQIEAILYISKAANIFDKLQDLRGNANCLVLMATNYGRLNQYEKSLTLHLKAYALRLKMNDSLSVGKSLGSIGVTYREMSGYENYNKAILYLQKAKRVFQQLNEEYHLALVNKEIGLTYLKQLNYLPALKNLIAAEDAFKKMHAKRELGSLKNSIGMCYLGLKRFNEAKPYLEQGLLAATNEKNAEHISNSFKGLYMYYKATGNDRAALNNHEKWITLKDSLDITANFGKLAELTQKYETEKKEQKIKLLSTENTVQKLSLGKQKTTLGIVIGASVTLLTFGGLLYNRNKNKQKIQLQQQQLEQRAELTKTVIEAEEKERTRIARDLHDGVGQLFSAVKMNLNGLLERIKISRDDDRFLAEKTLALVEESCKEVRYISHQMMPNILLRSGIASDVKSFLEKIDSEKLKVKVEANGFKDKLESNVETVLYRIIQETVNNVIKHAEASYLNIKLTRERAGISAVITDNGIGFDTSATDTFSGIGLKNIAARIEYLNGSVYYKSAPGAGTSVHVWVPVV